MHETTAFDFYVEEAPIEGVQHILLHQGRKRFGPPDEGTVEALKAIKDLDRLDRLAEAVIASDSWQDMLATP